MRILFPVKGQGVISQHFGENPSYYKQYTIGGVALKGHEGLDLGIPNGTEILSCDDGFCQEAIDQGTLGYGKYVKIIHSWGESVYAHLQEFKIKQGVQVKAGQTIALSDNTGNSTGPHLHFGIRVNPYNRADGWGGYSDPEPYVFGDTSGELDMPTWAKNLQPFFIENNLKDDQIEGTVRGAFGASKILEGFILKWIEKFNKPEVKDLPSIEKEIQGLLEMEDDYSDLVSVCEQLVGHFESETALRDALRVLKTDMNKVAQTNIELAKDNEALRSKRVLNRFGAGELIMEVFKKGIEKLKQEIEDLKKAVIKK